MNFLLKHKLIFIGAALGSLVGYLYYYFIGCASGTCMITSNPINSSLYGALMGALLFTSFKKENTKPYKNE